MLAGLMIAGLMMLSQLLWISKQIHEFIMKTGASAGQAQELHHMELPAGFS